jgi:hypothetical protein
MEPLISSEVSEPNIGSPVNHVQHSRNDRTSPVPKRPIMRMPAGEEAAQVGEEAAQEKPPSPALRATLASVPDLFLHRQVTRGEHLAHCISYALIRARRVVRGLSLTLSKDERSAVARAAVDELRRSGDKWRLDEEMAEPEGEVHTTPKNY